jgi:hypothetical protein
VQLGECLVWGDPHISTFDRSRADFYGEGIRWLVRSKEVSIQARYKATPFTNGLAATQAIAIGGAALQGHVLKVGPMESGQITWDDQPILTSFPSVFDTAGLGRISYSAEGDLVDSAQSHLDRHIVHVDFPSANIEIQVMRWANHINVRIRMSPQRGQDGHCGNFNGDASDDTTEGIRARAGTASFSAEEAESLFATYEPAAPGPAVTVDNCPEDKHSHALDLCRQRGLQSLGLDACVFDVCFGGDRYAGQDSALF